MNLVKMTREDFIQFQRCTDVPVIIYGAGVYGKKTLLWLKEAEVEVIGFCDRAADQFSEKTVEGIPVYFPNELKQFEKKIHLVIGINSINTEELMLQMEAYSDIQVNIYDVRNYHSMEDAIQAYYRQEVSSAEMNEKLGVDYLYKFQHYLNRTTIEKIEIRKDDIAVTYRRGEKYIKLSEVREMYFPYIIRSLVRREDEQYESEVMLGIINEDDVIFDIGANMGYYTILYNLNYSLTVYSFEPIEKNFNYLIKNLEQNGISADKAYQIGLSDEEKMETFYYDERIHSAASMRDLDCLQDKKTKPVICKVRTLDNFCRENNVKKIDFIKCDAEGSEFLIYKGGCKTIEELRPVVFSELCASHMHMFNHTPNEVIELFKERDYACFEVDPEKRQLNMINNITLETRITNYLFVPKEKISIVIERAGGTLSH